MGILDTIKRGFAASGKDNISILAAGVAYYVFLAIMPLLAAAVLGYGLLAEPEAVARHIAAMAQSLPASAAELIAEQLQAVVQTSGSAKGVGLLISLAVALFGARNASAAIVTAVSMAFNDTERRSMLRSNIVALAVTLAGLAGVGMVALAMTVTAALADLVPGISGAEQLLAQIASYAILATGGTIGAALLYRRAPPSQEPQWAAVFPGAMFAGMGIVLLTALFGWYVANFSDYNATYGSLGAVIVLLTWLFLSAYVLLLGAEFAAARAQENP
ncbi:hypothetical protein CP97_02210 [Aurantiacibacter atlanticus]|uniref:Uncharacterized protein n=1 Tax=Aurantiacibacter atlanticus TaxID=1648404 RepID=A0A0H4V9B9_9SPHN|nr:YihY/virulence factor BrkB family protein [Aurantiacibacter atlanticus]AKQ41115.1 hypothetical protein CP97_02210 [Aurantiacibacter atlanticus]